MDQDPQDQGTLLGTAFDDGFTPSANIGHITEEPTVRVRTENYYTPLYTESHDTGNTNINTSQHH
jgi:hypothetical protein